MSYSPTTEIPDLIQFQWSRPEAPNPRLAQPISSTDTTLIFTAPPLDHDDAVITTDTLIGIRGSDTYVETVYIPGGAWSANGLTATGVTRGIYLEGLDYTTGNTSLASDFDQSATVFCNVSAILQAMNFAALKAQIGANIKFNSPNTFMGDGILADRVFANAAARDAAITAPTNGMSAYLTDTGKYYDYTAGSWIARESGGSFPNGSTSVAGKYQTSTLAQAQAGTSTGSTGAELALTAGICGTSLTPTGAIMAYTMRTAPTGWLNCDGAAISRTTYATLFDAIVPTIGTPTISIASPAVVTLNSHGLAIGDAIYFTTTGALPTGITANTLYYVISAGFGANSFEISATRGGSAVNTSGSQSGTHTLKYCPYGLGDGSTTFNVPSLLGVTPFGVNSSGTFANLGKTGGAETVDLSHTHTLSAGYAAFGAAGGSTAVAWVHNATAFALTRASGALSSGASSGTSQGSTALGGNTDSSGSATQTIQNPYLVVNYIIKT